MPILLQFAYRQSAGESVPAPCDKATPDVDWWWDRGCMNVAASAATSVRRYYRSRIGA